VARRRNKAAAAFSDILDDAVGSAVDALIDRASDAVTRLREQARQAQAAALTPEQREELANTRYMCAGCKQEFAHADMEQVKHPYTGWGTCKTCYRFMWAAGREKTKRMLQEAAARRGQGQARPGAAGGQGGQPGFRPPPPPAGPPPYEVLGVAADASVEEIKKAYRQKAMMYHPDRVPATASFEERQRSRDMFETITRAYNVMLKVRQAPDGS
jgi:hypothetical protein